MKNKWEGVGEERGWSFSRAEGCGTGVGVAVGAYGLLITTRVILLGCCWEVVGLLLVAVGFNVY
jgi:hypothetical protein